jgi:predicted RNase H-like nuclease (RuvC/YqgF family)
VNPSRQPLVPRNTAPTKPLEKMTPLEAKTYKETRTVELDKEIMNLNVEKEQLEQELARMPFNSGGKTVAQRRRKKLVESRLDELIKEIGTAKRELRSMKRDVIV